MNIDKIMKTAKPFENMFYEFMGNSPDTVEALLAWGFILSGMMIVLLSLFSLFSVKIGRFFHLFNASLFSLNLLLLSALINQFLNLSKIKMEWEQVPNTLAKDLYHYLPNAQSLIDSLLILSAALFCLTVKDVFFPKLNLWEGIKWLWIKFIRKPK